MAQREKKKFPLRTSIFVGSPKDGGELRLSKVFVTWAGSSEW